MGTLTPFLPGPRYVGTNSVLSHWKRVAAMGQGPGIPLQLRPHSPPGVGKPPGHTDVIGYPSLGKPKTADSKLALDKGVAIDPLLVKICYDFFI